MDGGPSDNGSDEDEFQRRKDSASAEQRRRRQQPQQQEEEIPWGSIAGAVVGGLAAATVCIGAYKTFKALTNSEGKRSQPASPQEERARALPPAERASTSLSLLRLGMEAYNAYDTLKSQQASPRGQVSASTSWFHPSTWGRSVLDVFWKDVEGIQDIPSPFVLDPEAKYKHQYNKFDEWFQNLNRNIISFDDDVKKSFWDGFEEVFSGLLDEMNADPLFKYLFRKMYPSGSAWENLRISSPNEYDVNLILAPVNINKDVQVVDCGSGHIEICLKNGFSTTKDAVSRIFPSDESDSYFSSIDTRLKNWLDKDNFIIRSEVLQWMQCVVDRALLSLRHNKWTYAHDISRSTSGPAITVFVTMKNGKTFSMDLVPAFEFSAQYLPPKTTRKIHSMRLYDTPNWFAIPKGPRKNSSPRQWRSSLYQLERNLMKGNDHLKPSLRIMKRLRDVQDWKTISSYYLKTMFMGLIEEEKDWRCGLGQLVMSTMTSLEAHLRNGRINYFWDDDLNLLEDVAHEEYCKNVANYLSNIIKKFKRSVVDDLCDPMHFFGCDKNGKTFAI